MHPRSAAKLGIKQNKRCKQGIRWNEALGKFILTNWAYRLMDQDRNLLSF